MAIVIRDSKLLEKILKTEKKEASAENPAFMEMLESINANILALSKSKGQDKIKEDYDIVEENDVVKDVAKDIPKDVEPKTAGLLQKEIPKTDTVMVVIRDEKGRMNTININGQPIAKVSRSSNGKIKAVVIT